MSNSLENPAAAKPNMPDGSLKYVPWGAPARGLSDPAIFKRLRIKPCA
jgi:hypothetical protein